jgi:uncharacterized membrane-anchored protein
VELVELESRRGGATRSNVVHKSPSTASVDDDDDDDDADGHLTNATHNNDDDVNKDNDENNIDAVEIAHVVPRKTVRSIRFFFFCNFLSIGLFGAHRNIARVSRPTIVMR